jgi:hypothetical protein
VINGCRCYFFDKKLPTSIIAWFFLSYSIHLNYTFKRSFILFFIFIKGLSYCTMKLVTLRYVSYRDGFKNFNKWEDYIVNKNISRYYVPKKKNISRYIYQFYNYTSIQHFLLYKVSSFGYLINTLKTLINILINFIIYCSARN